MAVRRQAQRNSIFVVNAFCNKQRKREKENIEEAAHIFPSSSGLPIGSAYSSGRQSRLPRAMRSVAQPERDDQRHSVKQEDSWEKNRWKGDTRNVSFGSLMMSFSECPASPPEPKSLTFFKKEMATDPSYIPSQSTVAQNGVSSRLQRTYYSPHVLVYVPRTQYLYTVRERQGPKNGVKSTKRPRKQHLRSEGRVER